MAQAQPSAGTRRDSFASVRTPKTAELVATQLRNRIIRGELSEGDALPPEGVLLAELGVSRPTLREAFRILESEALLTVRRGLHGGAFVHAPNGGVAARHVGLMLQFRDTSLIDVYEARRVLETAAVRMLATANSAEVLSVLEANLAETEAVRDDYSEFLRVQENFHLELMRLAGNKTMHLFAEMAYSIIDKQQEATFARSTPTPKALKAARASAKAHEEFVDLVRRKAFKEAEVVWDRHMCAAAGILKSLSEAETVLDLLG